jgi:hypothetical protein
MATTETHNASALIARYIEPHPAKRGRAFARVKEQGVPFSQRISATRMR